jgi:hypothetical protein
MREWGRVPYRGVCYSGDGRPHGSGDPHRRDNEVEGELNER